MFVIDTICRINKTLGVEPKLKTYPKDQIPQIVVKPPKIELSIESCFLIDKEENKDE